MVVLPLAPRPCPVSTHSPVQLLPFGTGKRHRGLRKFWAEISLWFVRVLSGVLAVAVAVCGGGMDGGVVGGVDVSISHSWLLNKYLYCALEYSVSKSTLGQQLHLNSFSFDWAIRGACSSTRARARIRVHLERVHYVCSFFFFPSCILHFWYQISVSPHEWLICRSFSISAWFLNVLFPPLVSCIVQGLLHRWSVNSTNTKIL